MHRTAVLLLAVVTAACAADSSAASPSPSDGPGADDFSLVIVEGEPGETGISVTEALGHGPTDDIVAVRGALFVDPDGTVRLCEAIAESFPPQCGGASLVVEGLDLDALDLEQANGVRWAESIVLLGSVE